MLVVAVLLLLLFPTNAFTQRELHWDAMAVDAHLNADGYLQIAETQTLVFTGDWNGGERTFNVRPGQRLVFDRLSRWNGTSWLPMTGDRRVNDVDEYAWFDGKTLRWRSRYRSDPPFDKTSIRYELRYTLSGILAKQGDHYLLDHDFAFPDRNGVIDRFDLHLTIDPAWQPLTEARELYAARELPPGRGFVVTIPVRHVGTNTPALIDRSRPAAVRTGVLVIAGLAFMNALWLFVGEQVKGRFARIDISGIDAAWLKEHLLKFPAELVSAAWDDRIGPAEVVALLARMTSEGKLESLVSGASAGMTLHLKANRQTLDGYERKLIEKLFWGDRRTTSTDEVKSHYKSKGFNPVGVIEKDLEMRLRETFPFADTSRRFAIETAIAFAAGLVLLVAAWLFGQLDGVFVFVLFIGGGLIAALGKISGSVFRRRMEWGLGAAALCLLPALAIAGGTIAYLWFYATSGVAQLSYLTLGAIVALAVGAASSAIDALRSRQNAEGIAFRKTLTRGRLFFMSELRKPQPALRDEWYPWVLAFELGTQMDDWSARSAVTRHATSSTFSSASDSASSSSSSSSTSGWTGFGGGRSGGGGAGASWAAAAGGFAAAVAAPSSSSSGGGGSSSGGGGGGGSSGGGGGGGW